MKRVKILLLAAVITAMSLVALAQANEGPMITFLKFYGNKLVIKTDDADGFTVSGNDLEERYCPVLIKNIGNQWLFEAPEVPSNGDAQIWTSFQAYKTMPNGEKKYHDAFSYNTQYLNGFFLLRANSGKPNPVYRGRLLWDDVLLYKNDSKDILTFADKGNVPYIKSIHFSGHTAQILTKNATHVLVDINGKQKFEPTDGIFEFDLRNAEEDFFYFTPTAGTDNAVKGDAIMLMADVGHSTIMIYAYSYDMNFYWFVPRTDQNADDGVDPELFR